VSFEGVGTVPDWVQVAIAIIGVIGLIYTLHQNTEALRATHKDFISSNPPNLIIGSLRLLEGTQADRFIIQYKLVNTGSGAAWVAEGGAFPTPVIQGLYDEPPLVKFEVIPPIHAGQIQGRTWEFKWPEGGDSSAFLSGHRPLYLKGIFYYEDANGTRRYVQLYRILDAERLRFAPFPEGHFFAHDRMAY
jgi:hypothetical protein